MSSSPEFLTSARLSAATGVRHAFFTRRGGASGGIYAGLNCGPGSRDDASDVAENRRRAAAVFDVGPERLLTAWQIHSARALTAFEPWTEARPEGDAVVTDRSGLVCGALSADCAPVLLADPEARVVAAAHAGWRGALGGVVEAAVSAMAVLGARPERITAAVGPCIGPNSYEVGLDFVSAFADEPDVGRFFRQGAATDKRLFDLPAYVLHRLERSGVSDAEWIGADTLADGERFFSHRRSVKQAEGDYGRLLSAIALV